jgi:hypothetical protein
MRTWPTRIHDLQPKLIRECGIETWVYAANFYDTMRETLQTGSMVAQSPMHGGWPARAKTSFCNLISQSGVVIEALADRLADGF